MWSQKWSESFGIFRLVIIFCEVWLCWDNCVHIRGEIVIKEFVKLVKHHIVLWQWNPHWFIRQSHSRELLRSHSLELLDDHILVLGKWSQDVSVLGDVASSSDYCHKASLATLIEASHYRLVRVYHCTMVERCTSNNHPNYNPVRPGKQPHHFG